MDFHDDDDDDQLFVIYSLGESQADYGATYGCMAMALMYAMASMDSRNPATLDHADIMTTGAALHRTWKNATKDKHHFAYLKESMSACPDNTINQMVRISEEYTGFLGNASQKKDFAHVPLQVAIESIPVGRSGVLTYSINAICVCRDKLNRFWIIDTHPRDPKTGFPRQNIISNHVKASGVAICFNSSIYDLCEHVNSLARSSSIFPVCYEFCLIELIKTR